ncbi:hypothetical protein CHS0354_000043, partial [Potamilus streckersoni]
YLKVSFSITDTYYPTHSSYSSYYPAQSHSYYGGFKKREPVNKASQETDIETLKDLVNKILEEK